ncbi:hypothetical protein PEC302107_15520 [Pectobacterium araliae]|nr:hypothetical protein PEC302107_15520 [Pectobacterium carotovorum subsp. carotovorum]
MAMFSKITKFFKRMGDVYVSYCERIGSIISPF